MNHRYTGLVFVAVALALALASPLEAQRRRARRTPLPPELRGSKESVEKMYDFALARGLPFYLTPTNVDDAIAKGNARRAHGQWHVRAHTGRRLLVLNARGTGLRPRLRAEVSGSVRNTAYRDERGTSLEPAAAQRESTFGASHRHCRGLSASVCRTVFDLAARRARRAGDEGHRRGDRGAPSRAPACGRPRRAGPAGEASRAGSSCSGHSSSSARQPLPVERRAQ